MEKKWEEIMDSYFYTYTCSKCDFPVIWETPYGCSVWMLSCENCGYEYCYFESIAF
jgi:ribosomal protein L37AE/L43A